MVNLATEQPFVAIIILTLVIVLTALGIVYFVIQKRNGNGNGSVSLSDKIDRVDREVGNIREKITQLEMDLKVGFMECGGILKNMDRSIGITNKSIERLVNVVDGSK